jgi:hypothetical protein
MSMQAAEKVSELDVGKWKEQNEQDWKEDMQQLEGQMLQVMGGMEGVKEALSSPAAASDGRPVTLQQLADWMLAMHAPSTQLLHSTQSQVRFGDVKRELTEIKRFLKSGRRAGSARPDVLIPRSTLSIADGASHEEASGAYGTVISAQWGLLTKVAVKLHNLGQLRQRDTNGALREALVLSRLSHPNVMRCLGIVDDPDTEPSKSIHGSLVMNWMEGGQLYSWLRDRNEEEDGELPLSVRLGVALQVAAGMEYLHTCKVLHGDLKPQNVLLHKRPLARLDCPQVRHRQPACLQLCLLVRCAGASKGQGER